MRHKRITSQNQKKQTMKKYAIILLVLLVIGIGLSIVLFTQEKKLDQTVFLQTTESIRNLQTLDKNLRLLLTQSRYNSKFDHEQLTELNYQISEEFDNLRFDALFEEIEGSPELSEAIDAFEKRFVTREEQLENYIEENTQIAKDLLAANSSTLVLQQDEKVQSQASLITSLTSNKSAMFAFVLGEDLDQELSIVAPDFEPSAELSQTLSEYQQAITSIQQRQIGTQELYKQLSLLDTGNLLDMIEDRYVSYHNQAIGGSNAFRNALIGYGLALLTALIFFAYQIRKNYLSLEQQVADRTAEIETAYQDLQESQEQLVQSEKMASLGQMVAGVAHEINTPLGYVTSNLDTLKFNIDDLSSVMSDIKALMDEVQAPKRDNRKITEKLVSTLRQYKKVDAPELVDESVQLLSDGSYGLSEITKLVTSLKDFARLDRQSTEQIDIHDCLESSITIASNHIRENNVTVKKQFSDIPKIACYPSKLNQLFLNIISNACQAMRDMNGDLTIKTAHMNDEIQIQFIDQGVGMDEETRQKMFDPFYTSKEIGEGTGLGMSIAYKIIEAHNGRIDVESEPGHGTVISVSLPVS